jgi:hypothetical protein
MTAPQENTPYGFCHCGCGEKTTSRSRYVLNHYRLGALKHGHTALEQMSPTYNSWRAMIERCTNPKSEKYYAYGAKGIRVCERWLLFQNFLQDMGKRPHGKTIDRYPDRSGNYERGNCRWATPKEQSANSSRTSMLVYQGQLRSRKEVAKLLGIPYSSLNWKLRNGILLEDL